mgnify:CR=1 FL=1
MINKNTSDEFTTRYLDLARSGRDAWWVYGLGAILIILVCWLGFGGIATGILIFMFSSMGMKLSDLSNLLMNSGESLIDKNVAFLIANAAFPFFFIGILGVVRFLHKRPLISLVTGASRIRWERVWRAFGLWFLLAGMLSLLEYSLWSETFSIQFDLVNFGLLLLLALILTPIQTSAEELFFRGYFIQALSLATRNKVWLSVLSGVIFALPHFANPEVSGGFWLAMAYYFAFGFFLAWLTLKDGGLEAALGMHAANNLYGGVVVNFEGSALPTYALIFTTHFDPMYNLLSGVAAMGIFYALLYYPAVKIKPER